MRHVVTVWLAGWFAGGMACGKDAAPAPTPAPSAAAPAPAAPAPAAPASPARAPAAHSTCTLTASGGFTATETMPATPGEMASKYWRPDEEHLPALTVNCIGKDLRLSLVASPNGSIPYGPKTIAITAKQSGGASVKLAGSFDLARTR